jgi:hypothetical protein
MKGGIQKIEGEISGMKGRGRIEKENLKKVSRMEGIKPGICLNG